MNTPESARPRSCFTGHSRRGQVVDRASHERTGLSASLRPYSTIRRRLPTRLPRNSAHMADLDQAQAASTSATTSSSFRPLVLTLPTGVADWNAEADETSEISQEAPSQSNSRPFRVRSSSRRNRRLFTTTSAATECVRETVSSGTSAGPQPTTSSAAPDETSLLSLAFDSSPRLELPEHGLHSFKRSFEQATLPPTSPLDIRNSQTFESNDASPSGSSPTFSSSSPGSRSGGRYNPNEQQPSTSGFTPALSYSRSSDSPWAVPLPESWLRQAEDQQAVGSSTSILRHSPPTPENGNVRVKRRRSRSDDPRAAVSANISLRQEHHPARTGTPLQGPSSQLETTENEVPNASVETSSQSSDDWFGNIGTNALDFYEMSVDAMDVTSDIEHDSSEVVQELPANLTAPEVPPSEPVALSQSTQSSLEAVALMSSPESPSASSPVSVRRGLRRQFSLGTLPLFHFEEPETEDIVDEERPETVASTRDTGPSRSMSNLTPSAVYSRLPRPLRRPYLQRNTTAVSPPEESPINTPEEAADQRDAFSIYPGLRQWQSSTDQPSPTARTASGEFVQSGSSGFHDLRSRFGDQGPRLVLDFDIDDSITQQDSMTGRSNMPRGPDMPELVENARMRSTSATATSSTSSSSSLGTSWHSEAERSRAELLSEHLEASRRIAADVQRLQARLDATAATPRTLEASSPHRRNSYSPLHTLLAESSSTVPPHVSFSLAAGSNSRESIEHSLAGSGGSSNLWGEVDASSTRSSATSTTNMATASASITLQPNFTRRPGALGRSNMRGPTRSSNEAWMRSRGINFYDSLRNDARFARTERSGTGVTPIRSVTTSRIPTSMTSPTLPSFRRTTPTPVSSLPSSPTLPSTPIFTASGTPAAPTTEWPSRSNGSSSGRTGSEQHPQSTLPRPTPWLRSSGRALSAGHPGASQSNSHATGSFVPVNGTANSQRSPGPQLEAIRPLSPLFATTTTSHASNRAEQRRRDTLASEVDDDDTPGPAVHRLSTSLNNSREPISWLSVIQNADVQHTARREGRVHSYDSFARRADAELSGAEQSGAQPSADGRLSINNWRQRLQTTDARRISTRNSPTRNARRSSDASSSHSTSITDWFRGHTNEMPPERSSAAEPQTSAQAAADETEEASDGIAVAVRRLDDVRRLLDEVEQNMRRRRQSYEAGTFEQDTEAHRDNAHRARDTSATAVGGWSIDRRPSDMTLPRPARTTTLPLTHSITSVSRSSPSITSTIASRSLADDIHMPSRARVPRRSAASRPTLQPFEEIFAEVEAEFSQRDRTRSAGERIPGPRPFLHGLSRDRRREAEGGIAPYQPRERQVSPELSTSSLETIQSDLARLRRRLQRDWSPHRSGFALQDSTNTHLSDIAGLRGRQSVSPTSDFGLFDFGAPTNAREGSAGDRAPLPPFLLRSLRARRQATFGHREGSDDIAGELGNYAGDLELDMSYEGLLALSERLGEVKRRGATDEALSSGLTLFAYAKTTLGEHSIEDRETRCAICLEDYEDQDKCAKSTRCGHALHEECLTTWLRRNDTCPICRQTAV